MGIKRLEAASHAAGFAFAFNDETAHDVQLVTRTQKAERPVQPRKSAISSRTWLLSLTPSVTTYFRRSTA